MELKKRTALGKGLGALLSDSDILKKEEKNAGNAISEIPLEQIEVNPFQPRSFFDREALEELSASIREHGIIQPITVRRLSENSYQLISGERRLQASKLAGLSQIPAYVRSANDQQMLEMALIENIQREDLDPMEIANSYQRLIAECNLKHEELGERVGKKRSTVNNYLRLFKLPEVIQLGLRQRQLDMGHARALVNIDDPALQISLFNKIVNEGLSVRKIEEIVRNLSEKKEKTKEEKPQNSELVQVQSKLSSHFGTRVVIKQSEDEKGEIKIPFMSNEDLNRILEVLQLL